MGFKLAHLNVTWIPKHFDLLKVLMANKPIDILSINETRLDNSVNDEEIEIPDYEIFRKDGSRSGGGVVLYMRNVFNIIDRLKEVPSNLETEYVEIIKPHTKPLLITTVYRPPSWESEFMESLETYLHTRNSEDKELKIAGDFNCDLSWNNPHSHFNRLIKILNLFPRVIADPTRVASTHENLLDIIATKKPDKLLNSGVHLGISDQSLVYGCFKLAVPKQDPKYVESGTFKYYN